MAVSKRSARRRSTPQPTDVDTESRILDAAHAVFLRKGTAGARMQDIAKEAGVNHALVHYYFRTKDRLAEAVFRRAALKLLPPAAAILSSELPLEEKVRRIVDHELTQLSDAPHLPGYLLSELNHHPERATQLVQTLTGLDPNRVGPQILTTLHRQITESVRAGTMRPISAQQFAVNLVSLCIFPFVGRPMLALVLGWKDGDFAKFIAERKRVLPDFFLAALRP